MAPQSTPASVSLTTLLDGVVANPPALSVSGLCLDSRALLPGELFIACRGQQHDGRRFLAEAARAGAVAALVEDGLLDPTPPLPVVVVPALREQLGELAGRFYGHPSRTMNVAAVTGTNGKTTVSQLLGQLIRAAGYACGVIGTLGASLDGEVLSASHTTPDAIRLQATLADWAAQAVPFVSMEASSHALDQGRLNGLEIDTAVFTNLTRDHLDYHDSMQAYGEAKARLFHRPSLRTAILNAEDPFSRVLAEQLPVGTTALFYGHADSGADVRLTSLEPTALGMTLRVDSPWGRATVSCGLLGEFNALNLLAALATAAKSGLPFDGLIGAVPTLQPVPGRMEPMRGPGTPLVVIDYAHTPDALRQVLRALRAQTRGKLIAVFGCGGDRDRGKRIEMAAAVSDVADRAVLTSDNPRSEDPQAILEDIRRGMRGDYALRVDRGEAIEHAIAGAGAADTVLIAGKGHEDYQLVGGETLRFSDSERARAALVRYRPC